MHNYKGQKENYPAISALNKFKKKLEKNQK